LAEAAYLCANVTGEFDDTAKLLATLRDADPELRGSMHAAAAAALLLFNNGSLDAGHRLLVSTMRAQADGYDRDAEALYAALTALPTICLFGGRAELWEPFHEAIDVLGAQAPLDMRIVDHTWADPARTPPAILAELDGAIIAAADEPDPWKRLRAASLALFVDRAPATWSLTAQLIRGDLSDDALLGVHARSALSIDGFFKGAWDEVAVLIEQGEEICRRHRYDWSFFIFLHHRSLLTAGRGDRDELHRVLEVMHAWGAPRGSRHSHFAILHAQTLDALGHAEFERAYQLAAAISPPEAFASHVPIALWSAFDIVEAAVHTDRYPEAKARARALEDVAYISPRLALFAKAATALTSSDDVLPELVAQALEIPGADYFAFDYARVQLCFGERLRRLRATLRSRELLTAALGTFEAMGARRWAGRAANELSATGQRKNADRYAAAALTPQELEIAELAAAGLTNRQIGERLFLSHRTVGAHLYRIFPKLEVTTRAALRDALATHTSS
jgi:DNA-binding CsgD family transcriptional regulator